MIVEDRVFDENHMFDIQCGIDVFFENFYQPTATVILRQVQQKLSEVRSPSILKQSYND